MYYKGTACKSHNIPGNCQTININSVATVNKNAILLLYINILSTLQTHTTNNLCLSRGSYGVGCFFIYRFGFQVIGTLVVFVLLLVLLTKLPESSEAIHNNNITVTMTCDDDASALSSNDDMAFWVSGIAHCTRLLFTELGILYIIIAKCTCTCN